MPTRLLYIFVLISFYCQCQQQITELKKFGTNPGNLKMFVHIPNSKQGTSSKPLVVVLHGCSQSAESIAAQTGWNKLSDQYGFYEI